MLLPVQTEDSDIDEPLESGFHHEDEDSDVERFLSGFDIRSILPESLEELRIEGYFSPEAWDKVREMFREDSTSTPNLNKIWVGWRSKADHGVRTDMAFGEEPDSDDENDPSAKMLLGHGYP